MAKYPPSVLLREWLNILNGIILIIVVLNCISALKSLKTLGVRGVLRQSQRAYMMR